MAPPGRSRSSAKIFWTAENCRSESSPRLAALSFPGIHCGVVVGMQFPRHAGIEDGSAATRIGKVKSNLHRDRVAEHCRSCDHMDAACNERGRVHAFADCRALRCGRGRNSTYSLRIA